MAVFRKIQYGSYQVCQFLELPKYFWMGTMLFDKYTLEPISTYNTATLPIYENNVGMGQGSVVTPNNIPILCNINMILGQFGILKYGLVNYRNIPITNEVQNIPKSYIVDSMDDRYVYFVYTEGSFARSKQLVKWDMQTHSTVWSTFVQGSNVLPNTPLFPQWNISYWKQDNSHLYFIADALPSTNLAGCAYPQSFFLLNKRIIKILKSSGTTIANYPVFTVFEDLVPLTTYATRAVGFTTNHLGSLAFSSCLFSVDRNPTALSTLMFSCVLTTNRITTEFAPNPPVNAYAWHAGFTCFNSITGTFNTVGTVSTSDWSTNITFTTVDIGNNYTLGASVHAPRASQMDTDIANDYAVYMCWGVIMRMDVALTTSTDVRAIYRFKYIPSTNTTVAEKLSVLNTSGQPMTKADWKFSSAQILSQPYIIRGNGKKYLMIYDAAIQINLSTDVADTRTYLFEFTDANTLQLRDSIPFNVNDLLWLTDTTFVGATSAYIYIYKINTETGKFVLDKLLTPEFASGIFDVICIDDMFNLWYLESTPDIYDGGMNARQWNYLNSYTMSQIVLTPEQAEYTYVSTNITTYVDIAVYNDNTEIISKALTVTLIGPAKFESNNLKSIDVTTVVDAATRIPVTITGVGEVTYHAEIVQ